MIPKRVFSPSLTIKSLTSENRLKGNRRFDCESEASSVASTSSTSNNNKIKPLDPIKESAAASIEYDKKVVVIGKANIENGKDINDKNNSANKLLHNDVSHSEKDKTQNDQHQHQHQQQHHHHHSGSPKKPNNTELVNNLIGTPETAVGIGNCHRNIHNISQAGEHTSNAHDGNNHDAVDKIELSVKRCDVETKINNVPLRDVIQRKVTKLPNQLLNSSKELSSKLVTAASTTTSKNVSRTKRLLFRRKTTAITKDQIEVAKHLASNEQSPTTQNNEAFNERTLNASQVTVPIIESNYSKAIDTIQATEELEERQLQQQQHHQSSTSTKQKQANNITIVTNLQNSKRKNSKTDNKYKLDEVNKNAENTVLTTTSSTNDNVSTSKRYYFKQLPAANKIKSENFASLPTNETDTDLTNEIHDNFVTSSNNKAKIVNERKQPPPYIDPPPPQSSPRNVAAFNKQTNHTSCELQKIFKNNKAESDILNAQLDIIDGCINDDEHGNYAVPYVQSPTSELNVSSPPTVVNSSVYIRIANQPETKVNSHSHSHSQSQYTGGVKKPTNITKSQSPNNRALLLRQQHKRFPVQTQCKDNKDSSHDKSAIETEILLLDPIGQNFSSGGIGSSSNSNSISTSTSSSDSSNENDKTTHINVVETNQRTKMDPSNIINLTSPCDMLTKPEFSSSHLQNIPVRPRKGVPHLENYCLFDPSKDFVNEKELKKKYGLVSGDCMPFPIKILDKRTNEEELIKETIYEDHDFVYDTLEDVEEEDEEEMDENQTSYPNYFTIDPDYIEENKMESMFANANHLHPIVESETEDIYSDTNANVNKTTIYENQQATVQEPKTDVPLKKSPQIEKIVRQSSQPVISTFTAKKMISSVGVGVGGKPPPVKNDSSTLSKYPNAKVSSKIRTKLSPPNDLPLRTTNQISMKMTTTTTTTTKKRNSITMKHSVSTPQLSLKDLLEENAALPVVEIEIKNTVAPNKNVMATSVGNRASQYKFTRRPASQHSDADSGFLSPATPTSDAFNHATAFAFPQFDTIQGYIDVYTNWANHYLERVKSKKRVNDLQNDCRDGLLLADVVEGVTAVKVSDLIRKPKTQQQMFDNVNNCLNTLHTLAVGGLDGITTNDICTGKLRAILDLFYALSVYKQAAKLKSGVPINKQQAQPAPQTSVQQIHQPLTQQTQLGLQPNTVNASNEMLNRQLPAPYGKPGPNGTSIPLPSTVLVTRRCPPDKVRPLPPTPSHQIGANGKVNGNVETNALQQNGNPPTQIPKSSSGLRQQTACKIPASPYAVHNHIAGNGSIVMNGMPATPTKHSMLDKLKLFKGEKSDRSSKAQISTKRTSSSSGFSSARSERSDSSLSLNNDPNAKSSGIPVVSSQAQQQQQQAPSSNLKKSSDTSKAKSKLLSSSGKSSSKDTLTKKSEKKDKSPARTVSADMSESKIAVSKAQKASGGKNESKLKMISSSRKSLDQNRSESKTNISQIASPNAKAQTSSTTTMTTASVPAQMTTSSIPNVMYTSIPKPMAAIKGTTKLSNAHNQTSSTQPKSTTEQFNDIKSQKLADISSQNNNISTNNQDDGKMQIIAPILIENMVNQQQTMLANHLQMQQALNQQNISMSDTKSTHSSSTSSGPISSTCDSTVIYRPSSNDQSNVASDAIAMRPNPILSPSNKLMFANRTKQIGGLADLHNGSMIKASSNGSIASTASSSMTAMSSSTNGTNANKFNTVPTKQIQNVNGVIYEEEKQMTVMPMRPLLRGYNSHLTLPTRGNQRNQHMAYDYNDDMAQGYCSDGDALRKVPVRYSDIENGYMSEGGGVSSGSTTNGNVLHHKPMLLRARTQLPTTMEERFRGSRGEHLDSIGMQSHVMDMNGSGRHRSPLPPPPTTAHLVNGNGTVEQWSKLADTSNGQDQNNLSPTPSRKDKNSPSHSRRNSSSKNPSSRAKSAPQVFAYMKRNGSLDAQTQQAAMMMTANGGRTAHVSAVPRTNKMKVSGGTQTCTADLQTKLPSNPQNRSFSLTGTNAAQLSQSIRERLANGSHSLPKPGTDLSVFQHRMANRGSLKMTDGSLSDTQTYAEVKTDYGSYAMWLKHSNTATSRLSEGDTIDNVGIGSPARAHKMMQRESTYTTQSPRLNRSNSIRSTKSEKMYPSMLSRGPSDVEIEPYYCLPVGAQNPLAAHANATAKTVVPWSQPTSPTPPSRFSSNGPLSPTHAYRLTYPKKNDEVHGSATSLISGGSSLYGSTEDRQANEVRRLKRELCDARDQVMSLSSQLSSNAHLVSAFEQSLSNMTQRLQQLSATAERKDGELMEMRQTIELLRKQSIQAGLTTAHIQSMSNTDQPTNRLSSTNSLESTPSNGTTSKISGQSTTATISDAPLERHLSSDSMCSLNSISSGCSTHEKNKKKTGWLRESFKKAFTRNAKLGKNGRYVTTLEQIPSSHSISLNSSNETNTSLPPPSPTKGSPHRMMPVVENAKPIDAIEEENNPVVEDLKKQLREKDLVLTDIRLEALSSASQLESLKDTVNKMRQEMMNLKQNNERLQKMVTSRSLAGSEVSLGNSGPMSPNGSIGEPRRYSLADGNLRPPLDLPKSLDETEEENIPPAPAPEPDSLKQNSDLSPTHSHLNGNHSDHLSTPAEEIPEDQIDGKKISIVVYLGQPESFTKYAEELLQTENEFFEQKIGDIHENGFEKKQSFSLCSTSNEFTIAYTYISGKTTWQNLDYIVRKTFKDYLARIDPGTNLGLNTDSITSYHLGEAKRGPEIGYPELLPCGYIIGSVRSLYICLQDVGSLAFDSLIPRSIVQRYINLLNDHRRLILCGPSGTGKSYLARKLAEFLVTQSQRDNPNEAIATFNVDHKSSEELQHYLGHIAAQASMANGVSELPSVIILDNLHHASALGDVFQVLLSAGPASKLPCIIGTMSQATCNTTNLQLHHNFRWVLTANHMEPVKGFLARFLRRRLYTLELTTTTTQSHLASIFTWLPTVWQHINRFLETHSSSDVTIGPRLFLSCPLDITDAQVWFTDVWNYHLAPYLLEAVREGVQLYGRRGGAWIDPVTFVRETYPWAAINGTKNIPPLRQINAEDVGLDGGAANGSDSQDPLLNMLIRLQEAANYTSNPEQESDCASLDSNVTLDSASEKLETN